MEQKSTLKLIYKIHSRQLKKAKWNLNLPLEVAMDDYPELIVSLGDSQVLRFIDEINGVTDVDRKVRSIQRKIKQEKKKPKSKETKVMIKNLYEALYSLQFEKDYVCIIMDSNNDYDRANQGFKINGIDFVRFLGTNGGIKNSTIVYVNKQLYPELKKRLDNGRDKSVPLVPAKLEAYQALICSGSTPLPEPKGFIVVHDCITHFKDHVILINDEADGEPVMTEVNDYDIEHNDSDGYGLMLPSYARKVNQYLTGEDEPISGMNSRLSFEKGMVYTFDFVDFAEKIAGTYEITDVWGDKRDVRDAEVILTESMLKLWDCYDNWEDYYNNCKENHYTFSTPKITPPVLENVRNTNYQFLQSYDLTDEELQELCQPTIDEITGVLGMDYRKSLVFLAGYSLNEDNAFNEELDYCIRALMIDERMINDPFVRHKIWTMISKRIEMAKRGAIKVNANYAMISGDPYALCQSMFGMKITGLLKAGEVYHKYWRDKGTEEIACFRAPMTSMGNIRRLKVNKDENTAYWYQYIKTAAIMNCWDTSCEAMNGSDKDGDTNMDTDNPILVKNTLNSPTIVCVQRKADKKIVEESDIIKANKLAFNDDIGIVTNHVTSMFEIQAGFKKGSKEYETLAYRIKAGQLFQQNTIDRAKGIIAKPMPKYWYTIRDNIVEDGDDAETIERKNFNMSITAANKPYFMTYVYPSLKSKNKNFIDNNNYGAILRFNSYGVSSLKDLNTYTDKSEEMRESVKYFRPVVGYNPCTVNRICWLMEDKFNNYLIKGYNQPDFDYIILKSNVEYSKQDYNKVYEIYKDYLKHIKNIQAQSMKENIDAFDNKQQFQILANIFRKNCEQVCSNEKELCDIVLDICYNSNKGKQFAWDICGDTILNNLLEQNHKTIHYPEMVNENGDFEYCGVQFKMREKIMDGEDFDTTE